MMRATLHSVACIAALMAGMGAVTAPALSAEMIKIPVGEQHRELRHIRKPERGQSKLRVENEFGAPVQRYSARGEPPISRWEYPGFIVFFENDHVIHAVIKHRRAAGDAPP